MSKECQNNTADTPGTPLLELIEPVELFASFITGGCVRVERFDDDDAVGKAIGRQGDLDERFIVVGMTDFGNPDDALDRVSAHHDMFGTVTGAQDVTDIDRAIRALQGAREAILTAAMVRS